MSEYREFIRNTQPFQVAKNNRGLSTVEVSIVFPILMVVIFILIGILFYYARNAYLQAVVDDTLKHAVAIVAHPSGDFKTGSVGIEGLHHEFLFSKTIAVFADPYENHESICSTQLYEYLNDQLNFYKRTLNPDSNLKIQVTTMQFALFKKVRIEIYESSDSAFLKFYTFFSQESPPPIASGETMINDTPEMIRNVDYASEYAAKLKVVANLSDQMEKAREVIMNFIRKDQ